MRLRQTLAVLGMAIVVGGPGRAAVADLVSYTISHDSQTHVTSLTNSSGSVLPLRFQLRNTTAVRALVWGQTCSYGDSGLVSGAPGLYGWQAYQLAPTGIQWTGQNTGATNNLGVQVGSTNLTVSPSGSLPIANGLPVVRIWPSGSHSGSYYDVGLEPDALTLKLSQEQYSIFQTRRGSGLTGDALINGISAYAPGADPNTCYYLMEETRPGGGDRDYNDVQVHRHANADGTASLAILGDTGSYLRELVDPASSWTYLSPIPLASQDALASRGDLAMLITGNTPSVWHASNGATLTIAANSSLIIDSTNWWTSNTFEHIELLNGSITYDGDTDSWVPIYTAQLATGAVPIPEPAALGAVGLVSLLLSLRLRRKPKA